MGLNDRPIILLSKKKEDLPSIVRLGWVLVVVMGWGTVVLLGWLLGLLGLVAVLHFALKFSGLVEIQVRLDGFIDARVTVIFAHNRIVKFLTVQDTKEHNFAIIKFTGTAAHVFNLRKFCWNLDGIPIALRGLAFQFVNMRLNEGIEDVRSCNLNRSGMLAGFQRVGACVHANVNVTTRTTCKRERCIGGGVGGGQIVWVKCSITMCRRRSFKKSVVTFARVKAAGLGGVVATVATVATVTIGQLAPLVMAIRILLVGNQVTSIVQGSGEVGL
mmetsp:Transcript_23852/g.38881  ORF Transcript_23852/g.38881 Transcript_23852/m.38881 type:complete len:273 (+) Transcript_23852:249-1067(+)